MVTYVEGNRAESSEDVSSLPAGRRVDPSLEDFRLNAAGDVVAWGSDIATLTGYASSDIVAKHFTVLHSIENVRREKPAEILALAWHQGRAEYADWHVRKDGTHFWASVVLTAIESPRGFSVEMRAASQTNGVAEVVRMRNAELEEQLGQRTAELGERTAQLGVRTAELGVRTGELGERTAQLGVRTGELGERTAQLGVRTGELGERTAQLDART